MAARARAGRSRERKRASSGVDVKPTPKTLEELYARADALADAGRHREAYALFLAGAPGSLDCAERVGLCLVDGVGVRRDVGRGLRWLRAAERAGSWSARANIAVVYAQLGTWRRAAAWWARAVAAGDTAEGLNLAICLLEGRGVRRDGTRARGLLLRIARMRPPMNVSVWDHEWAMALLGVIAAAGTAGPRDLAAARRWLLRADHDGDYPQARAVLRTIGSRQPVPADVARGAPWAEARRARTSTT